MDRLFGSEGNREWLDRSDEEVDVRGGWAAEMESKLRIDGLKRVQFLLPLVFGTKVGHGGIAFAPFREEVSVVSREGGGCGVKEQNQSVG